MSFPDCKSKADEFMALFRFSRTILSEIQPCKSDSLDVGLSTYLQYGASNVAIFDSGMRSHLLSTMALVPFE